MTRRLAPKLERKIVGMISDMLQGHDFEIRSIKVDEDWSGDEAIFVELWYRLSTSEFDPELMTRVRSAVRAMLVDNDEDRFPFIRHHLPDGQKVKAA